jgi:N-methylhydantoinase A
MRLWVKMGPESPFTPDYFVGGSMPLDFAAAHNALRIHLAEPMKLGVERVAEGILEVATAAVANAIKQVTVRRGLDPRDFTLSWASPGCRPWPAVRRRLPLRRERDSAQ